MEKQLPRLPMVCFEDPESGELMDVDLRDEKLRQQYNDISASEIEQFAKIF